MAEFLRMHDQRSRETQEYLIGNYNKYKEHKVAYKVLWNTTTGFNADDSLQIHEIFQSQVFRSFLHVNSTFRFVINSFVFSSRLITLYVFLDDNLMSFDYYK